MLPPYLGQHYISFSQNRTCYHPHVSAKLYNHGTDAESLANSSNLDWNWIRFSHLKSVIIISLLCISVTDLRVLHGEFIAHAHLLHPTCRLDLGILEVTFVAIKATHDHFFEERNKSQHQTGHTLKHKKSRLSICVVKQANKIRKSPHSNGLICI